MAEGSVRASSRLRDRLADGIAKAVDQAEKVPTEDQKIIKPKYVDLNGIEPWTAILGCIPVFGMSYGFWVLTQSSAEWFLAHPIETEFYPVQRLGIAFQTAVVGLSSLAAGIFGFTALGLLLLGFRVLFGVATGELDPNKKTDVGRQSTAEKVRDIFTRDPVDVVMEERARKAAERRAREEATRLARREAERMAKAAMEAQSLPTSSVASSDHEAGLRGA